MFPTSRECFSCFLHLSFTMRFPSKRHLRSWCRLCHQSVQETSVGQYDASEFFESQGGRSALQLWCWQLIPPASTLSQRAQHPRASQRLGQGLGNAHPAMSSADSAALYPGSPKSPKSPESCLTASWRAFPTLSVLSHLNQFILSFF